mmetsp:Transcript_18577/g.46347  ORF Transcript_18577/g.46347 Transcript_18577/m.46347 type:complete len:432 (+) Transcript_18577:201-1496(+)|eukprot:CAMPEP_0178996424 /NCGR_PEP_ID=MMETSP0795-20121207/8359_1 /TAXON_ID=88552 /ORGANISM="Amoebophrya sp., Strain Ameob2" /LENGTH=431 /DNA_ID=CAMNT_0020688809 /DNA_START=134 /DNA_END=1429 /DNA_ORIENTATION=+
MFKKRQKPRTEHAKQEQEEIHEEDQTVIVHAAKRQALGRGAAVDPNSANADRKNQFGSSGGAAAAAISRDQNIEQDQLPVKGSSSSADEIFAVTDEFAVTSKLLSAKDFATKTVNVDEDKTRDQRAINERNEKIKEKLDKGELEQGVYRGINARKDYIGKAEGAISKSKIMGTMGPVRGNTTIRSFARFDYWGTSGDGGVCKEYLQTGFCGYGDSCIHMHDRTATVNGWKQERAWDALQKKKQEKMQRRLLRCRAVDAGEEEEDVTTSSSSEEEEDEYMAAGYGGTNMNLLGAGKGKFVPQTGRKNMTAGTAKELKRKALLSAEDQKAYMPDKCEACKEQWDGLKAPPVSTNCGHYLCETCAMNAWKKDKRCPKEDCGAVLDGIFNNCEDQWAKWKRRKAALKEEKRTAAEGGGQRTSGVEKLIGKYGVAY